MKIRTLAIGIAGLLLSAAPSAAQWDGCGFGVGGGLWMGQINAGGPVGIGSQGEKAGVVVNCDRKMGAFVAGGEVSYDWYFGDVNSVGAKNELAGFGRLGVLTSPANLLYFGAGYGRNDLGGTKVNGWKLGIGDEFRIPNSPMYLDLRATYTQYSPGDLGLPSSFKADSIETMARLKFKFGPGMFGGGGSLFSNEPNEVAPLVTDPKLAPSKR